MNKKQRKNVYAPLDKYEKELEKFLDKGEYVSSDNFKETKRVFQEAAERFGELQKSKSVTLRINQGDLIKIKARAKYSQIPYQTLISLLVHKYVEGGEGTSLRI